MYWSSTSVSRPVHDHFRERTRKGEWKNCKRVLRLCSQFFHNLRCLRAATQSCTQALKVRACSWREVLMMLGDQRLDMLARNVLPALAKRRTLVLLLSGETLYSWPKHDWLCFKANNAPLQSVTFAVVNATACSSPCKSIVMWCLIPEVFFSYRCHLF